MLGLCRSLYGPCTIQAKFCLPPERAENFGRMFDCFGHARLVLLGEATHGTWEFYRARAAITRWLIEYHGYSIVAVEADWPDAGRIDRYVRHLQPEPKREAGFARFPSWMWRNVEVDAYVWFETSRAVTPLSSDVPTGASDTYPFGL